MRTKGKQKLSLLDALQRFPDDDTTEAWFVSQRWPNGIECTHCGSMKIKERVNGRGKRSYRCSDCRKDFSTKSNSIMEASPIGYQKWAVAIYMLTVSFKGVSSTQLASDLNITQKSAWYMVRRIREAYGKNSHIKNGEASLGDKELNAHLSEKQQANCATVDKVPGAKGKVGKKLPQAPVSQRINKPSRALRTKAIRKAQPAARKISTPTVAFTSRISRSNAA